MLQIQMKIKRLPSMFQQTKKYCDSKLYYNKNISNTTQLNELKEYFSSFSKLHHLD